MSDAEALIATGRTALDTGEWDAASAAFAAALELEETPDALLGLADARWWLEDVAGAQRHRERAYAVLRRRGDAPAAAGVAMTLCIHYGRNLGNLAAAQGWLGRAARLVEENDLAPIAGWILLGRTALAAEGGDPQSAHDLATQTLTVARGTGDADLELCALSHLGAALVVLGRVPEGTALLDEAMAGALAGEGRPDTVVYTSCVTIVSCTIASELTRALQWIRAAEDWNRRYGDLHLYAVCRTHYGSVLFAAGRWEEAERELDRAMRAASAAEPVQQVRAVAILARLRVAQGRVEEAARLLDGWADHPAATHALATVRLAAGDPAAAAALLARRLRTDGDADAGSAPLLELLAEAELAQGDTGAATARARRLAALGAERGSDAISARGERALGRALAAAGDRAAAVEHLERALDAFARLEMPYDLAGTRLALAAALGPDAGDAAIAEGRDALAAFEALGAARDADAAAALLRSLGVKAARSGPKGLGRLTKRELEVLALLGEGLTNRQIAERLVVAPKTAENHVASVLFKLDLTGRAQAAAYAVRHAGAVPGER